jgi:methylenetetrahydrofolate reductase (NADPH)
MRAGACAFDDYVPWAGSDAHTEPALAPLILTDFSCSPFDPADLLATAAVLAPACDAVLVGEHQNRPDFPPSLNERTPEGAHQTRDGSQIGGHDG